MSDGFWTFVVIAGFIALFIFSINAEKQKKEEAAKLHQHRSKNLVDRGIKATYKFTTDEGFMLAQNNDGETWLYAPGQRVGRVLNYSTLLSAEVVVDGLSITHAHRGRQIGAAMVGGMLAGGIGAVIGGLGAKAKTKEFGSRIALRLTTVGGPSSIVEIQFLEIPGKGVQTKSGMYVRAYQQALEWCARMEVAMRVQPAANEPATTATAPAANGAVPQTLDSASQFEKWVALKEAGHITAEEFEQQKKRLLES